MILNLPQILKTQKPKIRKFKPLKTSLRTERWYREELLSLVKSLRNVVEQAVENPDNFVIHDSQDGNNKVRQDLSQIIRRLIERKIDDTAQRIAQGFVQRGNQQNLSEQTTLFKQATGIDLGDMLRASPKVAEKVKIATEANVALIKSIRSQYLDKVQTAVSQAVMRGALNKDLAAEIQKIGNTTESRAKLIARDQTSKFNAALSRARHEDAGATKYRWSTSGDERVRDSHAANDGKVFAYADPPATGNPGDEINCRCVAIPIFDESVKTEKELEQEKSNEENTPPNNAEKWSEKSTGKIELSELFEKSIGGGGNKLFANIGAVSERTIEAAKESIGLDISGWQHSVDESSVRHILKNHGNQKAEEKRGQRAVTKADFALLPVIISSFDSIEYTGTSDSGNETFLVKKEIDDEIYCVQEVRKRHKKLSVKTMWIRPKKKP